MWYLWPQEDDSSEAEHSMTEQKRPVLTLKRKTEGETPVRSRKTIINVTTPPKWKVKKQKLAEKAAREAELAAKKAQARQALSIYLNLPTLDEAVNTLKPGGRDYLTVTRPGFWPAVSGTCYWKTWRSGISRSRIKNCAGR
ncbi:hypothetical protein ECZU08_55510 [Escherichia coli]|nr:hypothetical protein ECZU08_55510 [Escherichia coli]